MTDSRDISAWMREAMESHGVARWTTKCPNCGKPVPVDLLGEPKLALTAACEAALKESRWSGHCWLGS